VEGVWHQSVYDICVRRWYVLICASIGLVTLCSAQDLWHQPWDGATSGRQSQSDTAASAADIYQFDNFVVSAPGWVVRRITIYGAEDTGGPGNDVSYHLRLQAFPSFTNPGFVFYNFTKLPGSGAYQSGNLIFDNEFTLAPGDYWLTAWVERPLSAGRWLLRGTTPVFGEQHRTHNPGGALGFGTEPVVGSTIYGEPRDLTFRIQDVPEASTLTALLCGLLIIRIRMVAPRT
jgi:hypothetical protein